MCPGELGSKEGAGPEDPRRAPSSAPSHRSGAGGRHHSRSFDTILIANRGEIAARIARSARALGYRVVGVWSEADAAAPFLDAMDEAVAIGPAAPASSYLAIDRLIEAARRTGAGAVHPGYGFLSESAAFAEACAAAGLVWIGASPDVLRRMGDKAAAKEAMAAVGVPCVAGIDTGARSEPDLVRAAARLGLPLLVKAVAGGGGRGMRRVGRAEDLEAALADARSEAVAAFGRGDLLVERALESVRHVEVQVLFDTHGHGVHLGERDCSAQRRHQKIVEESPSPALDGAARAELGALAVRACAAVGYVGAGTLEFLVEPGGGFHFLEMNPRLQVEHAVTEMVTGIDLVELQIRVAAGEPLPLRQADVSLRGHAIEARLYAEDPDRQFLPQSGTLAAWQPGDDTSVRIDHALRPGTTIPSEYDPLLAKIVAWGANREESRRRLLRAVERTRALGIVTNKRFLLDLLRTEVFVAGEMTTDFVERWQRERSAAVAARAPETPSAIGLAALVLSGAVRHDARRAAATCPFPWAVIVDSGSATGPVQVRGWCERDGHRLDVGGAERRLALVAIDEREIVWVEDGVRRAAAWARDGDAVWIETEREISRCEARPEGAAGRGSVADDGDVRAPMAAQVVAVHVAAGQSVEAGAPLVVLRAMKLEHRIAAPRAGRVGEVLVREGEQVAFRQPMLRLVAGAEPAASSAEAVR